MYRIEFDYIEIILANATNPTTMTYFTSLLQRTTRKGNYEYLILSTT